MGDVQPFNSLTSGTNAMQLKKLSPLAGLLLTALLGACGGGGDDEPPPPAAPPPAAVSVSAVTLSARAIAEQPLQFGGGVCGGGTGTLSASWDFGDGTVVVNPASNPSHSYADADAGTKTVVVTCTDTASTPVGKASLKLTVEPAAMAGFLGKTWTTYRALEANVSAYPVAGITSAGDLYGVWIRRYDAVNKAVAAGLASLSNANWTLVNQGNGDASDALDTGTDQSPYNDANSNYNGRTAPIDMAVSPNGRAIAAWMAGSSLYFSTKSGLQAPWTTATKITTPIIDSTVRVVVNDAGNGAIAYCTNTGAMVVPVNGTSAGSPQPISTQCGDTDTDNVGLQLYQRFRAFDVTIDANSKIYAVGVSTGSTSGSSVAIQTYSGAWSTATRVADNLVTAPSSLSMSLSPSGQKGMIAWPQKPNGSTKFAMYTSGLKADGTWTNSNAVNTDFAPSVDYTRPFIAVNDSGDVALTMIKAPDNNSTQLIITNCTACATTSTQGWATTLTPVQSAMSTGALPTAVVKYFAANLAIDKWGTALITTGDVNFRYSWAGTYSKVGVLSNLKPIGPTKANNSIDNYGNFSFRYQTMRATATGNAILTTAIYDYQSTTPYKSGFMLLK